MTTHPRSAWTAEAAHAPADLVDDEVAGIAVHWEGPPVPAAVARGDRAAVARHLEGIRRFHVVTRGWSDIAYQYAVDNTGARWELRGWRRRSAANGDTGPNRRYGAVLALIGQGQTATPAMLDGLRAAIADFRGVYPHALAVKTHNEVRPEPTECPGPQLSRLIRAGQLNPEEEDDMPSPKDVAHAVLNADELRVGYSEQNPTMTVGHALEEVVRRLRRIEDQVAQLLRAGQ